MDQTLEDINRKLGTIIGLLARFLQHEGKTKSLHEQIALLHDLGVRPKEIADALGRSQIHVNKELVAIRKKMRRK